MPYCTYCGIANIADAKFCKSCAARIGVPIINIIAPDAPVASAAPVVPVATVTQAMAATARLPLKSPLGAALLSWMWPGLGHCYALPGWSRSRVGGLRARARLPADTHRGVHGRAAAANRDTHSRDNDGPQRSE